MRVMSFNSLRFRTRWFCYLDLLGFTAKVESENVANVIPLYQDILQRFASKAKSRKRSGVIHSWFSDTFIIYTKNDTTDEFACLEHISRTFFQELILNGVPLRGAITHGKLYSEAKRKVFVGPALIDAYHYAERQPGIGFVLTPSVHARLAGTDLALASRSHYRLVTGDVNEVAPTSPTYAFAFNNGSVNGVNPYVRALEKLKMSAPDIAKSKYDHTIAFIREHAKK